MTEVRELLAEQGIRLKGGYALGDHKGLCPRCSHTRRKKTDPCLSVTIEADRAVWCCHNHGCGFAGSVQERHEIDHSRPHQRRTESPVKPKLEPGSLPANVIEWFAGRKITEATLKRNAIGYEARYMPAVRKEVSCIAFPYRRAGEVVNVKYRDGAKNFCQVKGAEKILYGLDGIASAEEIIIVEGEIDKLSLEEAGYRNAVSVPDGAPAKIGEWPQDPETDKKFEYLWNCCAEIEGATKIILATDGDAPGRALAEELARRLGRERCWQVTWPSINDTLLKDANEVLVHEGPDVLREVIAGAQPHPIKSLHDFGAFESETLALFRDGPKRALSTGWPSLDEHMKIREGELSVVTGIPGSGKSEFIDALMVNLARQFGWRFALCSFENPSAEHIAKLAEKYIGHPFLEGPRPRMTELDLQVAMRWLREHFAFIRADDEAPTIDWILETAKAAVLRYGVRGLVIDPYNEIEHKRPGSMSETEYVSQTLGKVKRFAQAHGVHVWFVAHPAKMHRDNNGKIPVPTLYDISGSANWANKADLGVVVHRDWRENGNTTEIYVRKVRFKAVGSLGMVSLRYDRATGRYSDPATEATQQGLPYQ